MLPLATMLLTLFLFAHVVLAAPLTPVRCDVATGFCMVFNGYGTWPDRSFCKVGMAAFPSSEQEIVDVVAHGVKNGMKMKVVSQSAHSIPKFACPGGSSGLVISTANYSSRIAVDVSSKTVTADSGVELSRLLQEIGSHGLALPSSPYWNGISLGGLLSTGSHGSSLWGQGSAVHEFVKKMTMVVPATEKEGFAKVITITDQDEDLNAAKVSLGVLGVISQVTLSLQPLFKRSVTKFEASDSNLEKMITEFGRNHEFADMTWYPSKHKVIYRADDRVPVSTSGDGENDFFGFQPTLVASVQTQRSLEEGFETLGDSSGKCTSGLLQAEALFATGEGFKSSSGGVFTGYPIVGFQHKIQSSGGCQHSTSRQLVCPWDPTVRGLFYQQTTVSISLEKISDFIADVKQLRSLNPAALCGVDLYNGFLMRYVRASSAYLGKQSDSVDIDITYFRARSGNSPRLDEDVLEEIEQMALVKYGGLPHWGKNRNVAFGARTAAKYRNLAKFLNAKKRFDPDGLFSSEWSDFALGITAGESELLPHCALEGVCVCSQDSHCAPERYHFCRPGRVFTDARVCRFDASGLKNETWQSRNKPCCLT